MPGDSEAATEHGGGKLKLIAIVATALIVLVGGGGVGAYLAGLLPFVSESAEAATDADAVDDKHTVPDAATGDVHDQAGSHDHDDIVFIELPDLLVNLMGNSKRMRFLKLRIALEVDGEDEAERIRMLTPRILDGFQLYLRSLEVGELQGAAALYRLKEEMMARVNNAIEPMRVRDVLFKEMLVQ